MSEQPRGRGFYMRYLDFLHEQHPAANDDVRDALYWAERRKHELSKDANLASFQSEPSTAALRRAIKIRLALAGAAAVLIVVGGALMR